MTGPGHAMRGLHPSDRVAEYRSKGYWNDDMIDALLVARVEAEPDTVALIDPLNRDELVGGELRMLTWSEINHEVSVLAAVLLEAGVGPGDVVAIQLPNIVEIVTMFLAIVRIGAVVTPFPVQYRSHELVSLSNVTGAVAFVTTSRIGARQSAAEIVALKESIPTLRSVLVFGDDVPGGARPLAEARPDLSTLDGHLAAYAPDPNDAVTICWTSGTESSPKGVVRTHYDWLAMSWATVDGPQLTSSDVLLNPFPMVNMAGINGMFLPWLRVGGVLVQHHPFDLMVLLRQIQQHRATYTLAPPAVLTRLLQAEDLLASYDLSSLRVLGSGSTPLAPSLLQGWHDRFGIEILNFYGSNEGIALLSAPADMPDPAERALFFPRYGTPGKTWSFRMADWMSVRVVDPDTGEEITEPGRPGELRMRGPSVFPGYLPACGVPDPFDAEGYLCTGDLVEIGGPASEYLHYVDRLKDVVVRGGMKISASELESLIVGHAKVAEVAVVAYPDQDLGERACAVVVPLGDPPTLSEIVTYLRECGVATFKLPERLEITDSLPRNPLGKVLKRQLRDLLTDGATVREVK